MAIGLCPGNQLSLDLRNKVDVWVMIRRVKRSSVEKTTYQGSDLSLQRLILVHAIKRCIRLILAELRATQIAFKVRDAPSVINGIALQAAQ